MKTKVTKPLSAYRLEDAKPIRAEIPTHSEITLDLESSKNGEVAFISDGFNWWAKLDDIQNFTDFQPARSVPSKTLELR